MQLSLLELLIIGVPEGFSFVLAIYVFTGTKIDKKKYIILSAITILITYLVRFLPISYGVNTLLTLGVLIFLFVNICKVEFSKAIKSVIIIAIILFACEIINVGVLIALFGSEKANELMSNEATKGISGLPAVILFGVTIIISYFVTRKTAKREEEKNGKASPETGK